MVHGFTLSPKLKLGAPGPNIDAPIVCLFIYYTQIPQHMSFFYIYAEIIAIPSIKAPTAIIRYINKE
jgi:hypothetical protein